MLSLTPEGAPSTIIGAAGFQNPVAIATHKDILFVADKTLGTVFAIDLTGKNETAHFDIEGVTSIAFNPTKRVLLVAAKKLWQVDIDTGKKSAVNIPSPTAIALSPDCRRFYISSTESGKHSIWVWSDNVAKQFCDIPSSARALCLSSAGLVAQFSDGLFGINLLHGSCAKIWKIEDNAPAISGVAWLPSKKYLTCQMDSLIEIPRNSLTAGHYCPSG